MSSVNTGTNEKTTTYFAPLAIEDSEEATAKFGCEVVAVVSDNERKILSMRSKLKSQINSLTVYGSAPIC